MPSIGTGLGPNVLKNIVMGRGVARSDYDKAMKIIDNHAVGGEIQKIADGMLYKEINSQSKLGKALRTLAKVNKEHYYEYAKDEKNRIKDRRKETLEYKTAEAKSLYPNNRKAAKERIDDEMEYFDIMSKRSLDVYTGLEHIKKLNHGRRIKGMWILVT